MRKRNEVLIFALILFINNALAVNLLGNKDSKVYPVHRFIHITDTPNGYWIFLDFLKNYNKYNNLLILKSLTPLSLNDIDSLKKTETKLFDFESIECLHNIKCEPKNNNKYALDSSTFRQKLIAKLRKKHIIYTSKEHSIYYLLFFNDTLSIEDINRNTKNDYTSRLYLSQDSYQSSLSVIQKYDPIELEKELELFYLTIESSQCIDYASPYCLIRNNNKKEIIKYINHYKNKQIKPIKLNLLLDYAYKSNNPEMSKLFTEMKLSSIYFPDNQSKLYAATYYNYIDIVDYLLADNNMEKENNFDINSEYSSGITLLDVALLSSSYGIIQLLIENGANKKGRLIGLYQPHIKSGKNKKYRIFEIYAEGYRNKETPDIFKNLIAGLIGTRGEEILEWFNTFYKEYPQLFKSVFIDSEEYAHRAILSSGFLPKPDMFDFLIKHGVDICFTFDKRSMKYFGYTMKKDKRHWLNIRYKEYLKKCKIDEN